MFLLETSTHRPRLKPNIMFSEMHTKKGTIKLLYEKGTKYFVTVSLANLGTMLDGVARWCSNNIRALPPAIYGALIWYWFMFHIMLTNARVWRPRPDGATQNIESHTPDRPRISRIYYSEDRRSSFGRMGNKLTYLLIYLFFFYNHS